jgi:hypothetical protein
VGLTGAPLLRHRGEGPSSRPRASQGKRMLPQFCLAAAEKCRRWSLQLTRGVKQPPNGFLRLLQLVIALDGLLSL